MSAMNDWGIKKRWKEQAKETARVKAGQIPA